MKSARGERPVSQGPYGWLGDASYLPTLAEVQAVLETKEGGRAVRHRGSSWPGRGLGKYEVWTQEYCSALAAHIIDTLAECDRPKGVVLEVGAAEGQLSEMLRRSISESGAKAKVVATDTKPPKTPFPVKRMTYDRALAKYEPTIAISSWMPADEDWTGAMRATLSLQEYILIGAPDITASPSAWHYSSPAAGGFKPVDLRYLDALKAGKYSLTDTPTAFHDSLTKGFQRASGTF